MILQTVQRWKTVLVKWTIKRQLEELEYNGEVKKTPDENYLTFLVTAMYKSAENKEPYSQSYLKLHQLDDNNTHL